MRLLVLGFPHVRTLDPRSPDGMPDQFTELIWNFCSIMAARGHEVVHIGASGSRVPDGVGHVDACTEDEWRDLYGRGRDAVPADATAHGIHRGRFAARAKRILQARCGDPYTSIVCRLWASDGATDDLPQFVVEYGIGYPRASATWRTYLSYAWLHFDEGRAQNVAGDHWYWPVIPLSIDPDLFGPVRGEKDGRLLYFGRLQDDKGARLAVQIARAAGMPIVLAGRGDGGSFVREWPEGATCIGPVTVGRRRELMSTASALLSPTRYVEPLGASALEAMASGCPVITTDWGGFTDTVVHADSDGRRGTGWRCRTFEEFLWAARNVHRIDPVGCAGWIARNHSPGRIGAAYEDYFTSLLRTQGRGGWMDASAADVRTGLDRSFRDHRMFG